MVEHVIRTVDRKCQLQGGCHRAARWQGRFDCGFGTNRAGFAHRRTCRVEPVLSDRAGWASSVRVHQTGLMRWFGHTEIDAGGPETGLGFEPTFGEVTC